jgi:mannose-6-phosphate isomerase-like protein (cupin superfamily)
MKSNVRRVDKPWGHELIFAHTEKYAGKILHVDPGEALSLQYHEDKDETLYLLSGSYELTIGTPDQIEIFHVEPGECYRVTPGTYHRMVAGGLGCDILEVSTPELEDVVRLDDRYGRVGTNAR